MSNQEYTKTNPNISYEDFYSLVKDIKNFSSITGRKYEVQSTDNEIMKIVRLYTDKIWPLNLKGVHQAYLNLTDFKTVNFKPYLNRTHSPALGLLFHVRLLIK